MDAGNFRQRWVKIFFSRFLKLYTIIAGSFFSQVYKHYLKKNAERFFCRRPQLALFKISPKSRVPLSILLHWNCQSFVRVSVPFFSCSGKTYLRSSNHPVRSDHISVIWRMFVGHCFRMRSVIAGCGRTRLIIRISFLADVCIPILHTFRFRVNGTYCPVVIYSSFSLLVFLSH